MKKIDELICKLGKADLTGRDVYFIAVCLSAAKHALADEQLVKRVGVNGVKVLREYLSE